jgi:hypothetical protein
MNIPQIIKIATILWQVSKPVAERIVRDAEYKKLCADADAHNERLRAAGGMAAWADGDGQDPRRGPA